MNGIILKYLKMREKSREMKDRKRFILIVGSKKIIEEKQRRIERAGKERNKIERA